MYYSVATIIYMMSLCFVVTKTTMFYSTDLCDAGIRLSYNCMTEAGTSQSVAQCCLLCTLNEECIGASWKSSTAKCYLHTYCKNVGSCTFKETDYVYFQLNPVPLPCDRGKWDESTASCKCDFYYVGELCDRIPYNCTDFYIGWPSYGFVFMGVIPESMSSVAVISCSRTDGNVKTMIARNTGLVNFNVPLDKYVNGINLGYIAQNMSFFTGLDAIRVLMGPNPRNLLISIEVNVEGVLRVARDRYTGVVIEDSSSNYQLRFEGHTRLDGTPGSCLDLSNMKSFSAPNADNDGDVSENWAGRAEAGWWFPPMDFSCNPLGAFYNPNITTSTTDRYVRYPGINQEDLVAGSVKVEMFIED